MASAKSTKNLPAEYQPLSAWAYFGYNLLYSVPIVGWIFMVVFALDSSNINRRNFTRSYFVIYAIFAIFLLIMIWTGVVASTVEVLNQR